MEYSKIKLQGSLENIITDIKSLTYKGELVYPNYPEASILEFDSIYDRFDLTPPKQLVTSAVYDENGNEATPAIFGDYVCNLILPLNYDTSGFLTYLT